MSSWELEYDAERDEEFRKYCQDVREDFERQGLGNPPEARDLLWFCLFRMWTEGLPAKEPGL